ncbi:NmrA family NAD(P)-binding protein [Nonomuraea sp. NPDC050783]|uniref:NmrA family NAD(P)-binding protein n=1 Tax=Nonomuraea sp. NPDC050783 TaxID=3154634 RepID=UPI003467A153
MILVTGVSGRLGGAILAGLRALDGVEVAGASSSGGGTAGVRLADFDRPRTLEPAFAGVDVLVFVSAGYAEDDVVLARHGAVVRAAAAAGVRHVVYTSLAGSGELLTIALAHRWTEACLAGAPFAVTVLRNGLYAELAAGLALAGAAGAAGSGTFAAPLGGGRLPVVARDDLAAAAVRVAAEAQADLAAAGEPGRHAGRTYELEGVAAVGGRDLAGALAGVLGRPVVYRPVPLGEARTALAGLMEPYQVGHSMSTYANVVAGLMEGRGGDLTTLVPEPRPVLDVITATLKAALAG